MAKRRLTLPQLATVTTFRAVTREDYPRDPRQLVGIFLSFESGRLRRANFGMKQGADRPVQMLCATAVNGEHCHGDGRGSGNRVGGVAAA